MAVPFSKPLYPGGPPRRVGPPRRGRPNHSQQNTNTRPMHPQQQPAAPQHHNQTFPEQTSSHQNQHPIERFLFGDGVIQLDRLSRVTRLGFYALFEAWRLLQDLSPGNQTRSITQGQESNQTFGHHITNISVTNNQAPVQNTSPTHNGLTVVEASNTDRKPLPDVVLASTQSRNLNSENSNLNREPILDQRNITQWHSTPTKKQSGGQVATCSPNKTTNLDKIWRSPQLNNHITSNDNNENEESSITKNNHVGNRNRRDSEANCHHLQKNRKFIDDQQVLMRNSENTRRSTRLRRTSFSTSDLPDLVPLSERMEEDESQQYPEFNIMNCDYASGGMKQKFDDDIDDLIDNIDFGKFSPFSGGKDGYTNSSPWEKGKSFNDSWNDDFDYDNEEYHHIVSDDKKTLSNIVSPNTTLARDNSNCPWSNSGLLLVELASAFEMSYGVAFETDQERQQYELYRRMKADILRNQARYFYGDNDNNMFGLNVFELGKAILSQALLTGMWFMLKRIKIV